DTLRAFLTRQAGVFCQKHRRRADCQQPLGVLITRKRPMRQKRLSENRVRLHRNPFFRRPLSFVCVVLPDAGTAPALSLQGGVLDLDNG
ncbi:hypothetical protein, partial [Neisseria bacilliformis]|uniref:hypothetical protein n=1 Tax=Neisseria bacilliformis TaxID=267212 RepID=UPI0019553EE0